MIFFLIGIVALFLIGLLSFSASSMDSKQYMSVKDFLAAKYCRYEIISFLFLPTLVFTGYGVRSLVGNEGLKEYAPELFILILMLLIGFCVVGFRMRKVKKLIGKNIPIESLEQA